MLQKRMHAVKHLTALLGLLATLAVAGQSFAAKQPPAAPVDVNTASVEQLTSVPGIGPSKAQAIVEYRDKAPFATTQDLVNVNGIGEKLLARIAPYVTVSSASSQPSGTAAKATR